MEQFDYILAQSEHLIYKQNTYWQHTISAEEKLAIYIRYLYLLSFAFQDLAKQGNQPATAANDVRNYFTYYFNSDHDSVEWQNDCA